MATKLPLVKIKSKKSGSGFLWMNAHEFDPKKNELFEGSKPAAKRGKPAAKRGKPAAKPTGASSPDSIKGIGQTGKAKLKEAGIPTVAELAAKEPSAIKEILGTTDAKAARIWAQASQITSPPED